MCFYCRFTAESLNFTLSQFGLLQQLYHIRLGYVTILFAEPFFLGRLLKVLHRDVWVEIEIMQAVDWPLTQTSETSALWGEIKRAHFNAFDTRHNGALVFNSDVVTAKAFLFSLLFSGSFRSQYHNIIIKFAISDSLPVSDIQHKLHCLLFLRSPMILYNNVMDRIWDSATEKY